MGMAGYSLVGGVITHVARRRNPDAEIGYEAGIHGRYVQFAISAFVKGQRL
jgi:hypothetical protein